MVKFQILFMDNTSQSYENIVKVSYDIPMVGPEIIEEKDLLTYNYPLGTNLHLFSEKKAFKVLGKEIKSIEVEKS